MVHNLADSSGVRRRRFQFTLRSLFLFTLYLSVLTAILGNFAAHCRSRAEAWIQIRCPPLPGSAPVSAHRILPELYLEHLRSRPVLELAANTLKRKGCRAIADSRSPAEWIADRLKIERRGNSGFCVVACEQGDGWEATDVVSAVADAYLEVLPKIGQPENQRFVERWRERYDQEVERLRRISYSGYLEATKLGRSTEGSAYGAPRYASFSEVEQWMRSSGEGLGPTSLMVARPRPTASYRALAVQLAAWAICGLIIVAVVYWRRRRRRAENRRGLNASHPR